MTDREQRQADLLDQFCRERAANRNQTPPAELDTGVASIAMLLDEHLSAPAPSASFVRGLDRRLASEAVPASNSHHHATLPAASDADLAAQSTPADWQPIDPPRRSRISEFTRIAATGLAVLFVGALLVLLFRDVDDAAAPGIVGAPTETHELIVSWDPHGGQDYKLFVVRTDSGEIYKLSPGPAEADGVAERYASWSPDGQRVVFAHEENGQSDIYVMNALPGSEPVNITRSPYHDTEPAWSPDGRRILFSSSGGDRGSMNLYIVDADGSNLEQLTGYASGALFQSWSPDGRQIAFARMRTDEEARSSSLQIWVMNADGSNARPLTNLDSIVDRPVWSPDGEHIAFWSANAIWMVNPDGSTPVNVSEGAVASSTPTWATNRQQILFIEGSVDEGDVGLAIADMSGAILDRWSPEVDILASPSWSPDDDRIAFYAGIDRNEGRGAFWDFAWDLRIAGADGSDERSLLEGSIDVGWSPAWRPVSEANPEPEPASSPTPQSEPTPVATEPPAPTPAMSGPPDPDDIPAAWLTHNDQQQRGEFAYGCNWPGFDICVDPAGLVFPRDVLDVPEGAELVFTLEELTGMEVVNMWGNAYPLDDADVREIRGIPFLPYPVSSEIELAVWGSADAMNVVADLPSGEYAIAMNINTDSGSATYGFHVRILEVDEPQTESHAIGTIVEVEQRGEGVTIYIIEHPEAPNNGHQYYVWVNRYARVFERTATGVERRSLSDLQVGRRVTVSFIGAIADSYPGLATGSEIVIIRTETDGPVDPQDTVTMTFQHSLYTGSDSASGGDAFYVSYSITGGDSGDVFICASDDRSPDVCGSWGATYRAQINVPRGAELHFSIYRLSRDNPDEPELVKRGREVVDADMITRSHYRYGAPNPGGYD